VSDRVIGATELVGVPPEGRTFTARRRVGLGDVDPTGRARLDAITSYQQDVATADYESAAIGETFAFVLRRNLVSVQRWPEVGERLELTTWAAGLGSRWAERRTRVTGDRGALVDCAAVWVSIGADGRPVGLPQRFSEVYGEATGGRSVTARLVLDDPPAETVTRPWPLRRTDIDTLGHVNNAAQWQAVEEVLQGATVPAGIIAEIEHRLPIPPDASVQLLSARGELWLAVDGVVATAARLRTVADPPADVR
jgi:acyl-ACP thioesterase